MNREEKRMWPDMIDDYHIGPLIAKAVPQSFVEAVSVWGELVINCEPHEWDNRTTEENALWLLCRLYEVRHRVYARTEASVNEAFRQMLE